MRLGQFARFIATLATTGTIAGCGGIAATPDGGGGADVPRADVAHADVPRADVPRADTSASAERSAGCGQATTIATGSWVAQSVTVAGTARPFFVRLPAGYDPNRSYPVVYQFHGCNDSPTRENNNVPVERESGGDAIHVRGRAAASCWDTAPTGPDVPYFDALVPAVEGAFCADTRRRFGTGYSSGSFMVHQLACIRGGMLRGVASIAGGQAGARCQGNPAGLLIHDRDDHTVNISASEQTRDGLAMRNGCDLAAARTPTDHPPCEALAGCGPRTPVVWCQTTMQDHSRQDGLAAPAFWSFLSSLAP